MTRQLGVSVATANRDVNALVERGLLERSHGGVMPAVQTGPRVRFQARLASNWQAKRQIGALAAALVRDRSSIFIDASTTGLALAESLAGRHFEDVTVVTNGLELVTALAGLPGVHVISTGGDWDPVYHAFYGVIALQALDQFHFEQAFLSTGAVSLERGATSTRSHTAETLQAVAGRSAQVYLMADHTKLGREALLPVLPISAITEILTDPGLEPTVRELFYARKVPLRSGPLEP